MSNYESILTSWALTGEPLESQPRKIIDMKVRNDLEFIGAQICFRHGARTPLILLPGIEEVSYSKEQIESFSSAKWNIELITKKGNDIVSRDKVFSAQDLLGFCPQELKSDSDEKVFTGQLTAIGEKQLYELGKQIRSEINKEDKNGVIPTTYDPNIIYCRSTFIDRTVASARAFLAGYFSSDEKANEEQPKDPFKIEVHCFTDEVLLPNYHVYSALKERETGLKLHSTLDDNHDLKKARQALIKRIGVDDYPHRIVELHDDIVSRQAHDFTVPEDILEITKDFESMSAREYILLGISIGFDKFMRAGCEQLLYLMKDNFDSIKNNYIAEKQNNIKKPYQKLFIYSAHDTTLVPLSMALEIFNMRWPKYAAHIFMKYYVSKTDPNETFVSVNYDGERQILPNCDSYYCPYSTFIKNLENRFEKPELIIQD